LSHLELVRALCEPSRGGVRLVYSKGYHPMPKALVCVRSAGGYRELARNLEVQWRSALSDELLREMIAKQLPSGLEIKSLDDLGREAGSFNVKESHYEVSFNGVRVGERISSVPFV